MKKSKIILVNIIRAIIMLIPYVGSSIDQITFGIKDSLKENEVINQLKKLEKETRNAYSYEKPTEKLISELIETSIFKETLEKIEIQSLEWKKNLPILNSKFHSDIRNHFNIVNEKHEQTFKTLNERIEFLEKKNQFFLKYFLSINDMLHNLADVTNDDTGKQRVNISSLKDSYQKIKKYSKEIGIAIKLSSRENLYFLLDTFHINEYVFFPFEDFSIDVIFLVYFLQKAKFKVCVINEEMTDLLDLKYFIKYSSYTGAKRNSIPKYHAKDKLDELLKLLEFHDNPIASKQSEQIFKVVSNKFLDSKQPHSDIKKIHLLRSLRIDVTRFSAINSTKKNYFTTALRRDTRLKVIHDTLVENKLSLDLFKLNKIVSPQTLAFMAFEFSNENKTSILIKLNEVYSKITESLHTDHIYFESLKDINEFKACLETIKSEIERLKQDLQLTLSEEIKKRRKVQSIFISAFNVFYHSYFRISENLDNQILSEINFEE